MLLNILKLMFFIYPTTKYVSGIRFTEDCPADVKMHVIHECFAYVQSGGKKITVPPAYQHLAEPFEDKVTGHKVLFFWFVPNKRKKT